MKKLVTGLYSAGCLLSFTMPGDVLANPREGSLSNYEQPADRLMAEETREKDCHLILVTEDFSLREASMEAGAPLNTLHLFISGPDGKIVKNAQVVTTIIDQQGEQQVSRALPFKGGYMVAVDHLPAGQYLVEAEIVTRGELLTDRFRFNKA